MPSQPRATASARIVTVAAWLILGWGCTGSGPGPIGPPRVCTLIGCDDGFKIDLDSSEEEVYRFTEAYCRQQPGFKPMEEWRAEISRKIAAQLEA